MGKLQRILRHSVKVPNNKRDLWPFLNICLQNSGYYVIHAVQAFDGTDLARELLETLFGIYTERMKEEGPVNKGSCAELS